MTVLTWVPVGVIVGQSDCFGGTETKVYTPAQFSYAQTSLVANDDDGNYVVVWSHFDYNSGRTYIDAQLFESGGQMLGNEIAIAGSHGYHSLSAVDMDSDGDFIITWNESYEPNVGDGLFAARFDATGAWMGMTQISSSYFNPAVAMDKDDGFLLVRTENGDILVQRYDASGQTQGTEFKVNSSASRIASTPQIEMDSDGDYVIVWTSSKAGDSDIYAQRFDDLDQKIGAEFPLNDSAQGVNAVPLISMNQNGNFLVAWDRTLSGSGKDIYARHFRSDGLAQGGDFLVKSFSADVQQYEVAMDDDGDFAITWDSLDAGGWGMYVHRYTKEGLKLGSEFKVSTTTAQFASSGTYIAMNGSGDFVVAWSNFQQNGSGGGVFLRNYDCRNFQTPVCTFDSNEQLVNKDTTYLQTNPATAMDADGDFVITWQSPRDGDSWGIFAQRYDKDGSKLEAEILVNTTTFNSQINPDIAMDSDGDFIITWEGVDEFGGSSHDIYAQRFDKNGLKQGSEFRVNTTTDLSQKNPNTAMDDLGNFVIVWESEIYSSIYGQLFDASGVPQGVEFKVNSDTTQIEQAPAVAMDSEGDFAVTWHAEAFDGSIEVFARRFNSMGTQLGNNFQVNTYMTSYQRDPAIAMDHNGNFVIAWESPAQDGEYLGIFGQRFDSAGVVQGSEFQINSHTSESQFDPMLAMDYDGNFAVAWTSYKQDGQLRGVYAQRFNPIGGRWGYEFQVNGHTLSNQSTPALGMDDDGDLLVAWQSEGPLGSLYDIYTRLYDCCTPQYAADSGTQLMGTVTVTQQYEADVLIESIQLLEAGDIHYDAGLYIELLPGFEVKGGAAFQAVIDGCPEE